MSWLAPTSNDLGQCSLQNTCWQMLIIVRFSPVRTVSPSKTTHAIIDICCRMIDLNITGGGITV